MKTHTLHIAAALGLLVCGGRAGISQQLSPSAPIIIRLSEIDRYGVSVWPLAKAMDGARLGLPYQDMKQSEVDTIVRDGVFLHRSVWVMDGEKIIAKGSLIGEFVFEPAPQSETKYGLFLGLESVEEAQKIGATLRLEPDVAELIRSRKSQLDDQRFWVP